jgi:outer membrane protein insertion porin family
LLLIAVVVAAGLFVMRTRIESWLVGQLERRAAAALDAQIDVGEMQLDPLRMEAEFRNISVRASRGESGTLRLEIPYGRVRLGWIGLAELWWRRPRLAELVLRRPALYVNREFIRRRPDRPARDPIPLDLRIGDLELTSGLVRFEERAIPLELRARRIDLQAAWAGDRRAIVGDARMSIELQRRPLGRATPFEVRTGFRWRGREVELINGQAVGPGVQLSYGAQLAWGGGFVLDAQGEVEAELDRLDPFLTAEFPTIGGRASGRFDLRQGPEPLRLEGEFAVEDSRLDRLVFTKARANAEYQTGRLKLREVRASSFGGEVQGRVDVGVTGGTHLDMDLEARGLDSRDLLDWIHLPLPLASDVDARFRFTGRPARRSGWRAEGSFEAEAQTDAMAGVPTAGEGRFTIGDGRLNLVAEGVELAATRLDLDLDWSLSATPRNGEIRIDGRTSEAGSTQDACLEILTAIGANPPELVRRTLAGQGDLNAQIRMGGSPEFDLEVRLTAGRWGHVRFDHARGEFRWSDDALRIRELELTDGPARGGGALRMSFNPIRVDEFSATFDGWDLAPSLQMVGITADVQGAVSGALTLARAADGLHGRGELALADGSAFGEPIERAHARIEAREDVLVASPLEIAGPGIQLHGAARWDLQTSRVEIDVVDARVSLAEAEMVRRRDLPLSGDLRVQGRLTGAAAGMFGALELAGDEWGFGQRGLGPLNGTLRFEGRQMQLELADAAPQPRWDVEATVGLSPEMPVDGGLRLRRMLIEPSPGREPPIWARVSGALRFRGPLAYPQRLALEGSIDEASLVLGARRLELKAPLPLVLQEGRLESGPLQLGGPDADLSGSLVYTLDGGKIELDVRGHFDLGFISLVLPEMRGTGRVDVALSGRGTAQQPELAGTMRLPRGRLRHLSFPHILEDLRAELTLSGNTLQLEEIRGLLGGGEIVGSGELRLGDAGVPSYEFGFDASNVRIAMPEGFEGVYDGRWALIGEAQRAILRGRLHMLRGLYDEEFELTGFTGSATREYSPRGMGDLPQNLELDIDIVADGNVWVRNDLVQVESGFDLHVGGDLADPELTGRLWLMEGGKLHFRDVDYRLLSGSLDFVELERLNPYVSILAETEVGVYSVNLRVDGPLDQFDYELSSNPALSTQDIIAVLTTGRTLEELTASEGALGGGFTGDLAANYFAGALTSPFSEQLEDLLKLERVQINPLLIQGESDPTARITLGKEVADDFFALVSYDVGPARRQLYQIEWQATNKLQLTAVDDTLEGVGGDVRYINRFWWKKPRIESEVAVPADTATPPTPAVPPDEGAHPVRSIEFEGVDSVEAEALAHRVPLEPGDPFSRAELFAGSEAIRRYFVRQGRIEAQVDARSMPATGADELIDVVYRVTPGPAITVVFDGISSRQARRVRRELETLWTTSLFTEDLYSDSAALIREYFQGRGFYAVDVQSITEAGKVGTELRFEIDLGKPVRVRAVAIEGAEEVTEDRVRRQMLTRAATLFSSRPLEPDVLEDDIRAIRNLYHDRGFLQVEIEPPRIRLSADADSVEIQLTLHEGPRFIIGELDIPTGLPLPVDALRERSGLVPGEPFSPSGLIQAESELRRGLDALGHPDARVEGTAEVVGTRVNVRFEIEAGGLKRVGEIVLLGNQMTKEGMVLKELTLRPGDLITRDRLLRSQHNLYRLGVFRSVRMSYGPMEGADDPAEQTLRIEIEEAKPLRVTGSAGWDTEGGARGSFSVTHDNVGGWVRSIGIQGYSSGIRRLFQIAVRDPRLFGQRVPTVFNVSWAEREAIGFQEKRRAVAVRFDGELGKKWEGYLRYSFQRVEVTEILDPDALIREKAQDARLGDFGIAIGRSTRDDPIIPTRGYNFLFNTRVFAKPLLSEFSFLKNTGSASWMHTFRNRTLFITALRIGLIFPFGTPNSPQPEVPIPDVTEDVIMDVMKVPISERFFAGGESTVRGFGFDLLGPRNINGQPIGGQGLLIANQEFRFPIYRQFRGIVFYDAGNVYLRFQDFDPSDVRHVLGAGLRYDMPLGPLRLEYGHKLDRRPGESAGEVFFAIGAAF